MDAVTQTENLIKEVERLKVRSETAFQNSAADETDTGQTDY